MFISRFVSLSDVCICTLENQNGNACAVCYDLIAFSNSSESGRLIILCNQGESFLLRRRYSNEIEYQCHGFISSIHQTHAPIDVPPPLLGIILYNPTGPAK